MHYFLILIIIIGKILLKKVRKPFPFNPKYGIITALLNDIRAISPKERIFYLERGSKMKLRRTVLGLLMSAAMLMPLAGCGGDSSATTTNVESTEGKSESSSDGADAVEAEGDSANSDFKEALDSYEDFMDDYVAFMEKYKNSDNVQEMMNDYNEYLEKYSELTKKMEDVKQDELTEDELNYYTEVMTRVSQKLLDAAGTQ